MLILLFGLLVLSSDLALADATQNFDVTGTSFAGANIPIAPFDPNAAPAPAVLSGGPKENFLTLKDPCELRIAVPTPVEERP